MFSQSVCQLKGKLSTLASLLPSRQSTYPRQKKQNLLFSDSAIFLLSLLNLLHRSHFRFISVLSYTSILLMCKRIRPSKTRLTDHTCKANSIRLNTIAPDRWQAAELPPQNMFVWHKDYPKLFILKTADRRSSENRIIVLWKDLRLFIREISLCKGVSFSFPRRGGWLNL